VTSLAFSPDGTILATGDENDSIYLWNVATGRRIATLTDSEASYALSITSVAPSRAAGRSRPAAAMTDTRAWFSGR
jgi:WD40 repeat protein